MRKESKSDNPREKLGKVEVIMLIQIFKDIEDPRIERCKLHQLIDILVIAICAVICGAETWKEMEEFGKSKQEWLESILELRNGIPSTDTFRRVISRIKPAEFQERFLKWIEIIKENINKEVIAIDGKTLRRSHNKKLGQTAIHIVSAWANSNKLVIGQVKTEEKSNEITAIPELLQILEITGCIVTIDAMGCQKEIAKKIIEQEADYCLALKANHEKMYGEVQDFFQKEIKENLKEKEIDYYQTIDKGHGRLESRKYWVTSDIDWVSQKKEWKNLASVVCVESTRTIDDNTSVEFRYYISSLPADAKLLAYAVRSHWGVENSLHWVLDVAFREDSSRIRKDFGAENFAILRHISLNLLKHEASLKIGIKSKRLKAGWDLNYLLKVLKL